MEVGSQDARELELLEEGLWRAEVRFNPQRMEDILAPDFVEFGRSGRIYPRRDIIETPARPIDARLPLKEFKARLLAPDLAQVTYVSAVTYEGAEEVANRSSIWSRTEDGWKLRFHQGTAISS